MTNAKTAKLARNAAPAHDEDMDKLVTEAEKQFAQRDQVQLVDLIDANTRGVLTLFPYTPRNVEAGKTYPAMTGHLDTKRVMIPVSAFAKMTDEGRQFLSLSIGPQGQNHIGGAVFRQEEQNQANGLWELTPGKENDRYGVMARPCRSKAPRITKRCSSCVSTVSAASAVPACRTSRLRCTPSARPAAPRLKRP